MESASHSFAPNHSHAHVAGGRLAALLLAFVFIALSVSLDSDFHTTATDSSGVETTRTITWALKLDGESPTESCDGIDEVITKETPKAGGSCDTHWHDLCQSVRWTIGLGFTALSVALILNFLQWAYYVHSVGFKEDKKPSKRGNLFVKSSWGGRLARREGQGVLGMIAWALFVAHGVSVHMLLVDCTDMPYPTTLYVLSGIGNLVLLLYGVGSISSRCFSFGEPSSNIIEMQNMAEAAGFY